MSDREESYCWDSKENKDILSELKSYYPDSVLFSLVLSFAVGLLFAPWSFGFLYLLIFIIVYEIIYACYHKDFSTNNFMIRLGIVVASIFGFIVGRAILQDSDPLRASYCDADKDVGCKWHIRKKCHRTHPHFSSFAAESLIDEGDGKERARRRRRNVRTDNKPYIWCM